MGCVQGKVFWSDKKIWHEMSDSRSLHGKRKWNANQLSQAARPTISSSWTITDQEGPVSIEYDFERPLPHPGEHLREDFLPEYGLTPGALAKAMGLKDRTRIERLVREQGPVTADTALRLAKVFNTTPDFWMNLQTSHDLSRTAIAEVEALAKIHALKVA
jgi:addiction module HigA family antidote